MSIPSIHQAKYKLNPNYVVIVKHDKLLVARFILKHVEKATWLSPIGIILKKIRKLWICIDFDKLNVATKKYLYLLPFIDEVLNIVTSHETYYFSWWFPKISSNINNINGLVQDFSCQWLGSFRMEHYAFWSKL